MNNAMLNYKKGYDQAILEVVEIIKNLSVYNVSSHPRPATVVISELNAEITVLTSQGGKGK